MIGFLVYIAKVNMIVSLVDTSSLGNMIGSLV